MTTDQHNRPISWLQSNTTDQFHNYRSTQQTNFMTTDQHCRPITWLQINTTDQFHNNRLTQQTNFMTTDQRNRPISWLQINTADQFHDYRSTQQINFMTTDQHYRQILWLQINTTDQFHDYRSTLQTNFMAIKNWWFNCMHVTHSDLRNLTCLVITGLIKSITIKTKVVGPITYITGVRLSGLFPWYYLIFTYYTIPCNNCIVVRYKNWRIINELKH